MVSWPSGGSGLNSSLKSGGPGLGPIQGNPGMSTDTGSPRHPVPPGTSTPPGSPAVWPGSAPESTSYLAQSRTSPRPPTMQKPAPENPPSWDTIRVRGSAHLQAGDTRDFTLCSQGWRPHFQSELHRERWGTPLRRLSADHTLRENDSRRQRFLAPPLPTSSRRSRSSSPAPVPLAPIASAPR